LENGIQLAACNRLVLDEDKNEALLASNSRLDLWGFDRGAAVDRAAAVLEERGADNYMIQVGEVVRAAGPGPRGEGWRISLGHLPALSGYGDEVVLKNQSLAVAHKSLNPLRIGGEVKAPYLDQRNGQPATGVVAVVTVTEEATDAQALAVSLFIAGSRAGQMLLGQLRPLPSVRWYLGSGEHTPLITDYHWSAVDR
jgi:thiamine biosynthesis lipoprotein